MLPLFETKALLNYYVFGRASGDVAISKDGNYLVLRRTVEGTTGRSSYVPVPDEMITLIINNLNELGDYYKAKGFKEVYFSIIPNSVTILQPEHYNGFIPRVQYDPRLKLKVIDIYGAFKRQKEIFYLHGDAHWNEKGIAQWVDMVNEQLKQYK
jgi:hypothetical protein